MTFCRKEAALLGLLLVLLPTAGCDDDDEASPTVSARDGSTGVDNAVEVGPLGDQLDVATETGPVEASIDADVAGAEGTDGADTDVADAGASSEADLSDLPPPPTTDGGDTGVDREDGAPGDGGDAAQGADTGDGGEEAGPLTPDLIQPGNLQLWLSGDGSVTCEADRVVMWGDRSPKARHAKPPTGKVGPGCEGLGGTLNGRKTVRFAETAGLEGQEYLEVDLSPLNSRPFTIALVEQRSAPKFNSFVIGSPLPDPMSDVCDVPHGNAGRALLLGYPFPGAVAATTWGPDCELLREGADYPGARVLVMSFAPDSGISLYVDGAPMGTVPSPALKDVGIGFIGRGWQRPTTNYRGDVAEVVVYDTTLSPAERTALMQYLTAKWKPQ